jgi:hypothetical protein
MHAAPFGVAPLGQKSGFLSLQLATTASKTITKAKRGMGATSYVSNDDRVIEAIIRTG